MQIYCDMNCNNMGNYFRRIGKENQLAVKDGSYIVDGNTFYPKQQCYKAQFYVNRETILYSEVIDYLLPKEYVRWHNKRFEGLKCT